MLSTLTWLSSQCPELFSSCKMNLYTYETIPYFPLPPAPGKHYSIFCLYELYYYSLLTDWENQGSESNLVPEDRIWTWTQAPIPALSHWEIWLHRTEHDSFTSPNSDGHCGPRPPSAPMRLQPFPHLVYSSPAVSVGAASCVPAQCLVPNRDTVNAFGEYGPIWCF